MAEVRVLLHRWEWACCGDRFEVGDRVSFAVRPPLDDGLGAEYGPDLATSITGVEGHHGDDGDPSLWDTLDGTVRAIHAVEVDQRAVRLPSPPGPAPELVDLGNGFSVGAGPRPPYLISFVPLPGSARLRAIPRLPPRDGEEGVGSGRQEHRTHRDPEDGETVIGVPGYVVDLLIG